MTTYNISLKKSVLEEKSVWAFHATGLPGFSPPKGKGLLLAPTPACASAAIIHPGLQHARRFQSLIPLLLLLLLWGEGT